eukprot:6189020-Pleurochrysis_carterae.AAC.3
MRTLLRVLQETQEYPWQHRTCANGLIDVRNSSQSEYALCPCRQRFTPPPPCLLGGRASALVFRCGTSRNRTTWRFSWLWLLHDVIVDSLALSMPEVDTSKSRK